MRAALRERRSGSTSGAARGDGAGLAARMELGAPHGDGDVRSELLPIPAGARGGGAARRRAGFLGRRGGRYFAGGRGRTCAWEGERGRLVGPWGRKGGERGLICI